MEYMPVDQVLQYSGVFDYVAVSKAARAMGIESVELAPTHFAYPYNEGQRLIAHLKGEEPSPVEPAAPEPVQPATATTGTKKPRSRRAATPPAEPPAMVPPAEPAEPPVNLDLEVAGLAQMPRPRLVELCGEYEIPVTTRMNRTALAALITNYRHDQRKRTGPKGNGAVPSVAFSDPDVVSR